MEITLGEAAARYDASVSTLRSAVRDGTLPGRLTNARGRGQPAWVVDEAAVAERWPVRRDVVGGAHRCLDMVIEELAAEISHLRDSLDALPDSIRDAMPPARQPEPDGTNDKGRWWRRVVAWLMRRLAGR